MSSTFRDHVSLEQPSPPTRLDLLRRWDANAQRRWVELSTSSDRSYLELTEIILDRVSAYERSCAVLRPRILDVGCGVGFLSQALAMAGYQVEGIDPSKASIALASGHSSDVLFSKATLEAFPRKRTFDVLVANMTLHCVANLPAFMRAAAELLEPAGLFVATIPNPISYLRRRRDLQLDSLDLAREHVLQIPFKIHNQDPHPALVYYFHRPLSAYTVAAEKAGLTIDDYVTPQHVGIGKPDFAMLELRHQPLTSNARFSRQRADGTCELMVPV